MFPYRQILALASHAVKIRQLTTTISKLTYGF